MIFLPTLVMTDFEGEIHNEQKTNIWYCNVLLLCCLILSLISINMNIHMNIHWQSGTSLSSTTRSTGSRFIRLEPRSKWSQRKTNCVNQLLPYDLITLPANSVSIHLTIINLNYSNLRMPRDKRSFSLMIVAEIRSFWLQTRMKLGVKNFCFFIFQYFFFQKA